MSVQIDKQAINLREKVAQIKAAKNTELVDFWFLGNAALTSFSLPKGFKPYAVYNGGLRVKNGITDEYTVSYDGSIYTVVFAVAPALNNDICIDGVRL